MREALSSLTTRGRAFIAAGASAVLCSVALGYGPLIRVGALLLLLPLVTAWFVGRGRYRLGLVRSLSPAQISVGQQSKVRLELTNEGRMPTGLLLLEEQLPYVLGSRPRYVINRMGPHWKRSVEYTVRSDVRGKYAVGPMSVRLSDPFGLVELDRRFQSTSSLSVTPKVVPLPVIALAGAWTGAGDNRPRSFATGTAEDVTVREYRRGDEVRRVHWRSSAKAGELMVRREEQPWQSRATIFVDNRASAHRGSGPASSFEHAVTITASVAVHLVQRGFRVRLITANGEEHGAAWHEHGSQVAESSPLLETMAVLAEIDRRNIDLRWLGEGGHSGLIVAVLGSLGEQDRAALLRIKHSASNALAVAVDVEGWVRGQSSPPGPNLASTLGYRTVVAGPTEPIGTVWRMLGHLASGRASGVAETVS